MRWLKGIAGSIAILMMAAGCTIVSDKDNAKGGTSRSRVTLELPSSISLKPNGQLLSNEKKHFAAKITSIDLAISAADMTAITQSIPLATLETTLDVPSGSARTFAITVVTDTGMVFSGSETVDLAPGALIDVTISVGVAGLAPTAVTATGGIAEVALAWDAVPGAASYNIYWSNSMGVTAATGTKINVPTNSYTHTALIPGARYYYVVTAVNALSESGASAEVSAIPTPPIPAAPTGVQATAGDSVNTLSWNAATGATSYNIYWGTATGVTTSTGTKISGVTSPYLHTGLTNGTAYYYIVTAVNAGGESVPSSEVNAAPQAAPQAPAGVSATIGNGLVVISWTAVTGATSYNVYHGTATGVTTVNGTKVTGATSGSAITGLTNGTTYYFVVTAVNAGGESVASLEVSATPIAPPAIPSGVSATSGDAQVTISWTAVTGATSYNVYYGTATGVTTVNGTKVTGATSGSAITGLTNGTTYYFVVIAVNAVGESAVSSEVNAMPQVPAPNAPTGVGAAAGNGQVALSWAAVTGATSYNVYYGTATGVTIAGTKVAGVTSGGAIALTNGTTYYFVVTAVNAGGESITSNEVSATPQVPAPSAPAGVGAAAGDTQVTVSWTAVTGATSYNVYFRTTPGVTTSNGANILGATSGVPITGLTNGNTYYFVVTAVNAGGESVISSEVSTTPQPPIPSVPTGVTATGGNAQVTVGWALVSGATTYNVYYRTTSGVTTANGTLGASGVASTTTTVSGLTNGTTYYFIVTAVNGGGESVASSEIAGRPGLAGPTGVTATSAGSGATKVSWNPMGITVANISGSTTIYNISGSNTAYQISGAGTVANTQYTYNVYWSTVTGVTPFNAAGSFTGISNNFQSHTGLTNGTTYYYVVTAIDPATGFESLPSAQVSGVAGGDYWTTKASMPTSRGSLAAVSVNEIIYAIGGWQSQLTTVEAYDPFTNSWATKAAMPTARYYLSASSLNGIIYVVGGYTGAGGITYSTVEAYNPATDTWTTKTALTTARSALTTAAVNGKLYAIGGSGALPYPDLSSVEEYDPVSNAWTAKAAMPTARTSIASAVVNGIIYVIGGASGGTPLSTVEAYNPITDTWTAKASMPTPRRNLGVSVIDGIIYAIGGDAPVSTVEAYNPVTNTWSTKVSMSTARGYIGAAAVNGTIYAIGGGSAPTLTTVEAYTPAVNVASNTWASKSAMITARSELALCALNGKIYAIGGWNGSFLASMEEFDTASGTWTNCGTAAPGNGCPSMATARAGAVCAATGGMIHVAGGYNSTPVYLASGETYDPATNTWSAMATSMSAARYNPAVAELNGKMYVMGGTPDGSTYANTVNIFDYTLAPASQWTLGGAFVTGRQMAGAESYGGKIFLMGGVAGATYSDIQSYDPVGATWTSIGNMPLGLYGFGIANLNGSFYISGGTDGVGKSTAYAYDPATGVWKTLASMLTTRWYHKSVVVNGKVYVVGGAESGPSSSMLEYTP